jgi:glyoxylase-like metal-dependent hydrolase (beta-lactamase superfamily II)
MDPTNCFLLKANEGYLLIDTSFPSYFKTFLNALKENNIELSQIKYLLLTHSHDDHAGFAAEIKEKTSCKIIAHKNAVDSLKQGSIINVGRFLNTQAHISMVLYNWSKRRDFKYPPVALNDEDIVIAEDNAVLLKTIGIDGRILYTPGHTNDGISIILANGDAFVGDACMSNLGFLHYRPIEVSDLNSVFESWQKIVDSGAKTVYPSHGKPFAVEELVHHKKIYAP